MSANRLGSTYWSCMFILIALYDMVSCIEPPSVTAAGSGANAADSGSEEPITVQKRAVSGSARSSTTLIPDYSDYDQPQQGLAIVTSSTKQRSVTNTQTTADFSNNFNEDDPASDDLSGYDVTGPSSRTLPTRSTWTSSGAPAVTTAQDGDEDPSDYTDPTSTTSAITPVEEDEDISEYASTVSTIFTADDDVEGDLSGYVQTASTTDPSRELIRTTKAISGYPADDIEQDNSGYSDSLPATTSILLTSHTKKRVKSSKRWVTMPIADDDGSGYSAASGKNNQRETIQKYVTVLFGVWEPTPRTVSFGSSMYSGSSGSAASHSYATGGSQSAFQNNQTNFGMSVGNIASGASHQSPQPSSELKASALQSISTSASSTSTSSRTSHGQEQPSSHIATSSLRGTQSGMSMGLTDSSSDVDSLDGVYDNSYSGTVSYGSSQGSSTSSGGSVDESYNLEGGYGGMAQGRDLGGGYGGGNGWGSNSMSIDFPPPPMAPIPPQPFVMDLPPPPMPPPIPNIMPPPMPNINMNIPEAPPFPPAPFMPMMPQIQFPPFPQMNMGWGGGGGYR